MDKKLILKKQIIYICIKNAIDENTFIDFLTILTKFFIHSIFEVVV